ncbi:hypothetical protein AAC691_15365 [Nguyenibacter vanlangensis]|uniref:Uncharacterized protein n=1 Tax=Nguyenibacter vanlangensis TaxID=1216886 RepID=A0ABZ3D1M3_9PROT
MHHASAFPLLGLLSAALVGLGNRVRGGLWGASIAQRVHWGSTTARIVAWGGSCALAAAISLAIAHGTIWHALLLVPLMWAGATVPMFGGIDLGRQNGTYTRDFCALLLHGVLCVLPACVTFAMLHYRVAPLLAAGILMPTCYVTAYGIRWSCPALGVLPADRPPLGELLFGAAVGLALTAVMLAGPH